MYHQQIETDICWKRIGKKFKAKQTLCLVRICSTAKFQCNFQTKVLMKLQQKQTRSWLFTLNRTWRIWKFCSRSSVGTLKREKNPGWPVKLGSVCLLSAMVLKPQCGNRWHCVREANETCIDNTMGRPLTQKRLSDGA